MDESSGPAPPSARRATVLVLDDDESIRSTVRRILELYDYEVLEAEDGTSAREVVDTHDGRIDVILCDLVLPGLGGREAANTLVARRPEARVLYFSGFSTHDSFRQELEQAGVPFLSKPFQVPELLEAVEALLAD